mmetsp:Transcript_19584/g.59306  ORF Transcript_19584/g.59306 Transcript_19584/m.59306 type:complete len:93 (-) Transcript_19584:17-295(-)
MASRKRKGRGDELRVTAGVDYSKVSSGVIEDTRFVRYKNQPGSGTASASASSATAAGATGKGSATFDAFMRMATGGEAATVRDRIDNPNRPT